MGDRCDKRLLPYMRLSYNVRAVKRLHSFITVSGTAKSLVTTGAVNTVKENMFNMPGVFVNYES